MTQLVQENAKKNAVFGFSGPSNRQLFDAEVMSWI
jgi:hypothetical protein